MPEVRIGGGASDSAQEKDLGVRELRVQLGQHKSKRSLRLQETSNPMMLKSCSFCGYEYMGFVGISAAGIYLGRCPKCGGPVDLEEEL